MWQVLWNYKDSDVIHFTSVLIENCLFELELKMLPDSETNVNNFIMHVLLQEMVKSMFIAEVKDRVSSRKATLAETAFNKRSHYYIKAQEALVQRDCMAMKIC